MIINNIRDYFLNVFVTKKRYAFIGIIGIILFLIYYNIVTPSNYSSISSTLNSYMAMLGTLLAIVISINTFTLQNKLSDMSMTRKTLENQLDKMHTSLELLSLNEINNNNQKQLDQNKNKNNFDHDSKKEQHFTELLKILPIYSDVLFKAISNINSLVIQINNNKNNNLEIKSAKLKAEIAKICKDIIEECNYRLNLYQKYKTPYTLIRIDTADYIVELNLIVKEIDNSELMNLYNVLKTLHVVRNIGSNIFLRNSLNNLSIELLAFTIPIIVFIGAIVSISDYNNHNTFFLRILITTSISIAIIPFIILFIKTIPILYLLKDVSTIPFGSSRKERMTKKFISS